MIWEITEENKEPVIKLAGSNLLENGFNVGDIISVSFSENEIIISKNSNTSILQKLQEKNPSLKQLCKEFNLDFSTE